VLVHIHDIFLPDDYPSGWGWRNYNEQQAIVPMLAWSGWRPVFGSHYARRHLADRLARSVVAQLPSFEPSYPSSLWLERPA
jgi:hypothetical protein